MVSVAGITMIKGLEILTFIANVRLSVADVSVPISNHSGQLKHFVLWGR